MSLPKNRKLDNNEFQKVQEKGKVYQSNNFGVSVLDCNDENESRFAFVVSKKISNLAVHRNRVKRSLSEAVRQNMVGFPKGYSLIFLPKKSIATKTTEEIMSEVKEFLGRDVFKKSK